MTKSKSTQKALLTSVISLILSCVMLFGTTFAWFNDKNASSDNRILSGNLDIDLLMYKNGQYISVSDGNGDIFAEANGGKKVHWEPGKTEIVYLAVKNKGTLALKYNIKLNITDGGLAGELDYAILDNENAGESDKKTWEQIKTHSDAQKGKLKRGLITITSDGMLNQKAKTDYFAVAVHMPEDAKNSLQGKSIIVDLTLLAAQAPYEEGTFGKGYDKDAKLVDIKEAFVVTKSNISTIDFNRDNAVYKFSGNFDTLTLKPGKGLNQVFEGSLVTGVSKVVIITPEILDSYENITGSKEGCYTVTGFKAKQIEVFAYDTSVNITANKAEFIYVDGANLHINISENEIDGEFKTHNITEKNIQNDFGVYCNITDYDLEITQNTVTNTKSHAVVINGRQGEDEEFAKAGADNKVSAFSENTITVNSDTQTERAALKFESCAKYAPFDSDGVSKDAEVLTKAIKTKNNFNIGETHMHFGFN